VGAGSTSGNGARAREEAVMRWSWYLDSVDYVINAKMRGFAVGTRYRPHGLALGNVGVVVHDTSAGDSADGRLAGIS
jgi:hypothetical protein